MNTFGRLSLPDVIEQVASDEMELRNNAKHVEMKTERKKKIPEV